MSSNRHKLNSDKTQFIWLGTRQQLSRVDITSVSFGSDTVNFKNTVGNLGVTFDSQLAMKAHVQHACSSSFYQPRQLRSVQRSLSFDSCSALVHAFIASRLDYCNSLLAGINNALISKLQSVLWAAARLVLKKRKFDPISDDIRDILHWLPVHQRIDFKLGLLVYKCLHGNAPGYLSEMLKQKSEIPAHHCLRSFRHGFLEVPFNRSKTIGPRSFATTGPTLWNSLPEEIRDGTLNLTDFKKLLKTHLFKIAVLGKTFWFCENDNYLQL